MGQLHYSWYFRQRTGHIYQKDKVQFILTGRRLGHLGRRPLGKQNKTRKTTKKPSQTIKQKQEVVNYIERLFFHATTTRGLRIKQTCELSVFKIPLIELGVFGVFVPLGLRNEKKYSIKKDNLVYIG